jgi:hypothetical protein
MSKIVKATILLHSINSYFLLLRIQESTELFTKRKDFNLHVKNAFLLLLWVKYTSALKAVQMRAEMRIYIRQTRYE